MIDKIYNMYKTLYNYGNFSTLAGKKLHEVAISCLGLDIAPLENEYGCAEAVNNIVFKAFGDYAGGDLSTSRMYHSIKNNRKFIEIRKPLAGDIILSPTGYGNGRIANGHTGIVSFGNTILSNDSATGKFMPNYTTESWNKRFVADGGYPIFYFRRIWF